ncbi:zinc ribbon domain-containing protein [Leptospira brenneri]|uniref:Zinc ribbon domain-containing protein n=1 Tax=Leptospira brenneri TaxID=2023182 RepID=A0A5F1ZA97_9LEPT|nr:zinc ribbon domain-containing protein [Leptospira brenneri]
MVAMAEEKIYEMLWDCEFCGSKKLLGKTHRHCPNCGATQDPTRRYFPNDADKVAVQDHVYYGVDKVCPFCQTPNGAKATFCGNCGGSLDGAQNVKLRSDQDGLTEDSVQKAKEDLAFANSEFIKPHPKTPKWVLWLLGSILFGGIGFVCLGVLWTEKVELQITHHEWSRTIAIDQFKPVSESEWCDSMPMGAYSVSRSRQIRSYNSIADGEDCRTVRSDRGDGTFSESESCTTRYRKEPVYDDHCSYRIDKWAFDRNAVAKGFGTTQEPYWPSPQIRECISTSIGCERLGNKTEKYMVYFTESSGETKGEKHDCEFDQTKWKSLTPKAIYQSEKSVIFNYITCDTIQTLEGSLTEE